MPCPGGKERTRRLMSVVEVRQFPLPRARHSHVLARSGRGGVRALRGSARLRDEGRDPPVSRKAQTLRLGAFRAVPCEAQHPIARKAPIARPARSLPARGIVVAEAQ